MATAGIQALNSIPFGNLIGGPLTATVQAQAQAAMTCIEFIEHIGFDAPDANNHRPVKTVEFKYTKTDINGEEKNFVLSVPILAVVPIPYLRVDEVLIDFSAKLTDVVTSETTTSFGASVNFSAGWGAVKLRGNASYKNDKSTKSSSSQEYNMSVKVRAVQAEVPGGMQKILDMLETAISDKEQASSP